MKVLNGRELADFIKARQAHQVRALRQADHVFPKLAILTTSGAGGTPQNPIIETYMRLKQHYGADILIEVEIHRVPAGELNELIQKLNQDATVHGMIVQLPLDQFTGDLDQLLSSVAPPKDVDALGARAQWDPATPMAINWLLAGYNIDLKQKHVVIVGDGRLVGHPLARMWRNSGVDVTVLDETSAPLHDQLIQADAVVTATGVPNLIRSDDLKIGAVVVDAGTASENGRVVGDLADDVRLRSDLIMTPIKGGVGPLTITALMDNVIRAARATIQK
jgi:methylenetetrahydrofolate dehydrogenase (NADP+)/methenyltetrahydrofolate cyclohydrolase